MTTLPDRQEFLTERGKFDPNLFAKWIVKSEDHHFIALRDTDELLMYRGGVYVPEGDKYLEEMMVEFVDGLNLTTAKAREAIFLIKRRVMHDRKEIDCGGEMINLSNGLYNMRTGEMSPHTPKYISVRQMGFKFDPDATCPNIDKFISEVVSSEDILFIYELFGYMLLPDRRYRTAVFLEGRGANGKSVLMDLMKAFIGGGAWADITPGEMNGSDPYARAELFGKLLNVVDDLGNGVLTGLGAFKSIITGNDVRAQRKYGHGFVFKPTVLCVFGCNEVPETTDTGDGFMSRMRCINFPNRFDGSGDNKNLTQEITTECEMSGMFNMAVAAIKYVVDRGHFTGNTTVEEKRRTYLNKSSNIYQFIEEGCDIDDVNCEPMTRDVIFDAYAKWCIEKGYEVREMGDMTTLFKKLGKTIYKPTINGEQVRCYKGVRTKKATHRQPNRQGIVCLPIGIGT